MPTVLRGLLHRAGTTAMILAVAVVTAAAASVGPTYYAAARFSILQDTVRGAPFSGRGFEAEESGSAPRLLRSLAALVHRRIATDVGAATAARLFAPPLESIEAIVQSDSLREPVPLVWRTNFCAHLAFAGSCPSAPDQVLISQSLAGTTGWRLGQRLRFAGLPALVVAGVYRLPDTARDYWFGHGSTFFQFELPEINAGHQTFSSPFDAMFTRLRTITAAPPSVTGDALVDELLRPARLHTADVQPLSAGIGTFVNDTELGSLQISIISGLPFTLSAVQQSWTALAIPVVLITAQLLVLAWLLMFLVTVDVIEARAGEVALAKLRGYQGSRAAVFGLAEPSVLLVVALPIGALIGWLATVGLSRFLLRPGTPVGLPALGWAAAAVAAAGGLAAVGLAARDTLRRPVLEQWRRTAYRPRRRGWVVDAVLLTATSVGLVELLVGGRIGSARRSVLALLVPGLLGLAVAVVAARALPAAGRPLLARTRHGGGVGGFLAVRQLIRRPGAARTTIVLATSFALAAFAVNAFAVGRTNYRTAAEAQVGAPTVLTVSVPGNRDLTSLVDRADPSGRQATAVDELVNTGGGGQVVYAVDPTRFARIAFWRLDFGGGLPDRLARALHPPEPAPVVLRGDALRLTVKVRSLDAAVGVVADVTTTGASGVTPVSLGNLPSRGAVTLTGALVDCPCVLDDLSLNPSPSQTFDTLVGDVVFRHAMVHRQPGWRPVDVGFRAPAHWEAASPTYRSVVSGDPSGLRWRFSVAGADIPAIDSVNRPYPMPVIAASRLTGGRRGRYAGVGLDGNPMAMRVLAAVPAVPGAPAQGLVVDQRYALLAAAGQTSEVTPQVWLAAGAERRVLPQLTAAGVRVLTTATVGGVQRALSRQGPALAGVLFVADAAAAAVLASAGAVLGIYASGRRRRYEYAALVAAGLSRKSLRRGLLTEQLVVLVFGTVVGLGAGVAAVALALRSVPEFVHPPSAPPPAHPIAVGALGVLVGVAVGVLAVSAVVAGLSLIRQVRLEQLREATP